LQQLKTERRAGTESVLELSANVADEVAEMWSNLNNENTNRTADFITDWSRLC